MLSLKLNKQALRAFEKHFKALEEDAKILVRAEVESSVLWIEEQASIAVPVNIGTLKQSIQSKPIKEGKTNIEGGVEVGAYYAPYVEFGTGTKVEVPAELTDFAMEFKGAGIKEVNLPARPFFYPAVWKQRIELPKRIKKNLAILFKRK